MEKNNNQHAASTFHISEVAIINDPSVVPILFHEKKQMLLSLIIPEEKTIIDIKNITKMNPGTIKRHLDDLVKKNLAVQSRFFTNEFGIKMKYYRAVARKFLVQIEWPSSS
ncbi:hypothetical protein NEF87_000678 [Candidatus Lokiarchaeum ossiferum]|uniref:HTH arsR-type domain-containing protein n=1 Tax=Candidatus Lokiarchaeum ossiferum TaxID=2951803 RepID=A0ABY6HLK6_9ARCH|nr:hypothetical protein NEF87_000678 [Candidatus Lokiarchaeum sp. B-35]